MGFLVMGREHPKRFPRPGHKRCGLEGSHPCLELHFQACRTGEDGAALNVLDDDAFSALKGGGRILALETAIPEIKPPLGKSPLAHNSKVRRRRIQELDVAEVSPANGNGNIHNLVQEKLQTSFVDGEHGEFVQPGHRIEFRDQLLNRLRVSMAGNDHSE